MARERLDKLMLKAPREFAQRGDWFIPDKAIIDLLQQEAAYQRARVMRIVKQRPRFKVMPGRSVRYDKQGEWISVIDLLTALKGRAR